MSRNIYLKDPLCCYYDWFILLLFSFKLSTILDIREYVVTVKPAWVLGDNTKCILLLK